MGGAKSSFLIILAAWCIQQVRNQSPLCSHCNCSRTNDADMQVHCLSDIKDVHGVLFNAGAKTNDSQIDVADVQELTIRYNELGTINETFRVVNVVVLDLAFNKISHLWDGVFSRLQKMETLVLSHNDIQELQPGAFLGQYKEEDYYPLRSLRTLMLDHNDLHSLNPDLFEHVESIETLSLAYNPLEELDPHTAIAITNLVNLKSLDLSYTQLSSIPKYFLHTPKNIKVFNLSGNSFTGIPRELEEAQSLETFVFNDNAITELTKKNGFPKIPTLRVLHLCQMSTMTTVGAGSLSNLTNLEELFVAGNPRLTRIDQGALATSDEFGTMLTWPNVKKLYINDNQISYINKSLLAHWSSLAELDLLNNPWTCECENQWMVETLIPIYLNIDEEKAKEMKCAAPAEMTSFTFEELYRKNYNMRCLDFYGAQPEKDASIMVGMLAGLLLGIPLMLFFVYSYRRHWFGLFDDSPASFSRQFYTRTNDIYEY